MEFVEEDSYYVCLEKLPKNVHSFKVVACCGKGYHDECLDNFFSSNMTNEQKSNVHIVK